MIFEKYIVKRLSCIFLSLLCHFLYANQPAISGLGHIYVEKGVLTTFDFSKEASTHSKVNSASETFTETQGFNSEDKSVVNQIYVVEGTVITGISHFNASLVTLPNKHSLKKSTHHENDAKGNAALHQAKRFPKFPMSPLPQPTTSNLKAFGIANVQVKFARKYFTINKHFLFNQGAYYDTLAILKYAKPKYKTFTPQSKQTYTFPYVNRCSGLAPPFLVES